MPRTLPSHPQDPSQWRPPLQPPAAPNRPRGVVRPSAPLTLGLCVVACVATALLLWALGNRAPGVRSAPQASTLRTAAAMAGELVKTLRVGGIIETMEYAAIRAPSLRGPRDSGRAYLTLMHLAEAGSLVRAGGVVAEFELRWLEDHIEDRQSYVVQAEARLQKKKADVMILKETERQARVNAEAEYSKAMLDLRTSEVRSEIEAEILKNVADEARVTWEQLEEEGRLMEGVHRADVRSEELQVREEVLHVERHERDYERLQMRTPIPGMVVRETMFNRSGQFAQSKAGDQIYPGALFMRIVDVSRMVVAAAVNQVDAQLIRIGSEATVHFDAYPGLRVKGHVADLGAVASSGGGFGKYSRGNSAEFVKHLPVRILIDESDERILPDLSASADIQIAATGPGVLVPREAIHSAVGEDARDFVHVLEDGAYRKRWVEIEDVGDTEALVRSGIEVGEQVLLSALPAEAEVLR